MCAGNKKCKECAEKQNNLEDSKYLDFDGDAENISLESDDDFANASDKRMSKLEAEATSYQSLSDCLANKRGIVRMKNWRPACETMHGTIADTVNSGGISDEELADLGLDSSGNETPKSKLKMPLIIGGTVVVVSVLAILLAKQLKKK